MLTIEDIATDFERNRRIIQSQCEGLTHEDSLIQPPFASNCLNWTVGHVVVHRDKILDALGHPRVLDDKTFQRYTNESDPVLGDGPGVRPLSELLGFLEQAQARLTAALPETDFDAAITIRDRPTTIGRRVHFLYFHESYHTGQTELLRALAGRTDKVI